MYDKILTCIDCKRDFPFTKKEQEFYQKKEFSDPKRCAACRKAKKEQRGY